MQVALWIIAIASLLMVFFLFAIWRAIMGKSGVDLKLSVAVSLLTKKLDTHGTSLTNNSKAQSDLQSEVHTLTDEIKKFNKNANDETNKKFRGDN